MSIGSFDTFLKTWLEVIKLVVADGASLYICLSPHNPVPFWTATDTMEYREPIVWEKPSIGQLGDGPYRHTHESLLYCGFQKGMKWNLRTNESDVWEIRDHTIRTTYNNGNTQITIQIGEDRYQLEVEGKVKGRFSYDEGGADVWVEKRDPVQQYVHPTQKPVELVKRAIFNSSDVGDIVLDPFGGSGTTLVACERTKRRCRMIELDPLFADVIVKRWENMTNSKAVRV